MATSKGAALLVAGTDTGVGKTVVSALLLAALRRQGRGVLAMKPVESGCAPDPLDAPTLAAVTGQRDLDEVCPYRLAAAVAPQSAAAEQSVTIDLGRIREPLRRMRERSDLVLVESAGGLGTPYGPGLLVLDLARELDLPLLLVGRHALGTVGQLLVALRLLRHEGLRCVGVVLSETTAGGAGPAGETHRPLLEEHGGGVPLLGILPHLAPIPDPREPEAVRAWTEWHLGRFEAEISLAPLVSLCDAG